MKGVGAVSAFWSIGLALAAPATADNPHSINHIVTAGLSHAACLRKAAGTLRAAKLAHFSTTSSALWAYSSDKSQMASIYCLSTRDVAVVAVSGPDRAANHQLVDRLLATWRRVR
jgi:hypothetical protein